MNRVQTSVTINRPVEEVFAHVADGRLFNRWKPGLEQRDVRLLTPEPLGPGARFRGTFKGMGELDMEVVEYAPPRRVVFLTPMGMGEIRRTVVCEPADDGRATRLTEVGEGRPRGLYRLLMPLLRPLFQRGFDADSRALKAYLEAPAH